AFLANRRWFAERGNLSIATRVAATIPLATRDPGLAIALVEAKGRETAHYLLPLTIKWNRFDRERHNPNAVAAVRRGPREGTLFDASADVDFVSFLLEGVRAGEGVEADGRRLELKPTSSSFQIAPTTIENVRAVDTEQSNTTLLVGNHYVVKLFR